MSSVIPGCYKHKKTGEYIEVIGWVTNTTKCHQHETMIRFKAFLPAYENVLKEYVKERSEFLKEFEYYGNQDKV